MDLKTKKCPFCAESIKAEAIVCRYCQKDQPKNVLPNDQSNTFSNNNKTLVVFAGLLVASFIAIFAVSAGNSAREEAELEEFIRQAEELTPPETANDWAPTGYKYHELNQDIAYMAGDMSECSTGTSCFNYFVISRTGCPSGLYMEANLLQNGVVEEWSNDSLAGLPAFQEAKMSLNFNAKGSGELQWTEVNCY
jgi:hypothetical protein